MFLLALCLLAQPVGPPADAKPAPTSSTVPPAATTAGPAPQTVPNPTQSATASLKVTAASCAVSSCEMKHDHGALVIKAACAIGEPRTVKVPYEGGAPIVMCICCPFVSVAADMSP